jgi:hypothetical protein
MRHPTTIFHHFSSELFGFVMPLTLSKSLGALFPLDGAGRLVREVVEDGGDFGQGQ